MERNGLINATGVDGCNIILFDGVEFAREVSRQAEILYEKSPELSKEYIKSMGSFTIKMEKCTATFDNKSR
jgi:hypothetical protein